MDIRNTELYECSNTGPLRSKIVVARWSLFGHILRLDREAPARLAMDYYGELEDEEKGPNGRPITTLPVLLFNEYRKYKAAKKERGWRVKKNSLELLDELRKLAEDRGKWTKSGSFLLKI